MDLKPGDVLLCEFYFPDLKTSKHRPVIVFKDNLPSRQVIVKKYGQLSDARFQRLHQDFCRFFGCC